MKIETTTMATEYVGGRFYVIVSETLLLQASRFVAFSKVFTLGSFRYGVYFRLIPLNARRDRNKMSADTNESGFARTGSREITRVNLARLVLDIA